MLNALRRARLRSQSAPDVVSLVRAHIGLHSTDYATPYLSALARVEGFDPAGLFARLQTGDGLVRLNAFRSTVHVVHADDAGIVSAATGAVIEKIGRRSPGLKGLSDKAIDRGVDALCAALEGGPQTNAGIKAAAPELAGDLRMWMYVAMGRGLAVRADGPHARSNRVRYALARDWCPFERPDVDEARRAVLLRAVDAFGPITADDLAWWLPATKGEVKRVLASAGPDYASFEEGGQTYWFHGSLDAVPDEGPLGAWLLPYEDSLLKGYKERDWLLAPGLRDVVFPLRLEHWAPPDGAAPATTRSGVNVSGEARPSIWWDGRVVGRWEERAGGIVWQLHADVGTEATARIGARVAALEHALRSELGPLFST
ncbi:MAG: AlkZ family DNA glycosylase [Alphaproteobacteria bacterium]|nr:AlkZ family DNA glycosylase [Alphaproteobacteria bacterium]